MNTLAWAYVLGAYTLGAIPTGYWLGKAWRGIDIREHGSGNLGATNVMRVLGKGPGILTLLFDIGKGAAAVLGANHLFPGQWQTPLASAIAAILGQTTSPFVQFKGGKGVATTTGAFGALLPIPTLIAATVFGIVLAASRIVSLSSIFAAIALSLSALMLVPSRPLAWSAVGIAILVIFKHRANIGRLLSGTESKIGRTTPPSHV